MPRQALPTFAERLATLVVFSGLVCFAAACSAGGSVVDDVAATDPAITESAESGSIPRGDGSAFTLRSAAFAHGDPIPPAHSCDGDDLSPPLSWSGAPVGTVDYALIVEDPDSPVGLWTHWLAWGFSSVELPEGIPADSAAPRQGTNTWDRIGYRGPCPPTGYNHRYLFRLYALDTVLDLASETTREGLLEALDGHVLAEVELLGYYER